MPTNEEYLIKAIDTTWGGQLNADDINNFYSGVRDQSGWLSKVNWIGLDAGSIDVHSINITNEIRKRTTEATANNHVASGSAASRTLTLAEFTLPYDLSFKNANHNILGDNTEEYLNSQFQIAVRNGIVGNVLSGSSTNPTPAYAIFSGLNALAEADTGVTNTVSTSSATNPYKTALKGALDGLPRKYRTAAEENLVFLTSYTVADGYSDESGNRETPAGDQYRFSGGTPDYRGIPVVPVQDMPEHIFFLTSWKNMFVGYANRQGVMSAGMFKNDRAAAYQYTINGEAGFQYAQSDLVVRHSISGSLS